MPIAVSCGRKWMSWPSRIVSCTRLIKRRWWGIQIGGRNLNSIRYKASTVKELRSFGLTIGAVVCLIGLWPLVFRGETPQSWVLFIAAAFIIQAVFLPKSLAPIHRIWIIIGSTLGWINTRIILGLGFYGIFTPLGWLMRMVGKDPMRRRFDSETPTYRVTRLPRKGSHMQRQF